MIKQEWFTEHNRRSMIDFLKNTMDEKVQSLTQTPTSDNIVYESAIVRADIAWLSTLLHFADPTIFNNCPLTKRVKEPLTSRQYDNWRVSYVDKLTKSQPSNDPVTATYIHRLINNGVNYGIN